MENELSQERLQASVEIDRLPSIEIVRIIQREDAIVAAAVAKEEVRMAQAIDQIAERLRSGGHLFYVGAGTSGRIAMLDASELPPTYGVDPTLVRVIMAGGLEAFNAAVEGAEDSEEAAVAAINAEVKAEDAVIGIAASGTTPFTVAALRRANMLGALTVGVTSIAGSPLARECDIAIAPHTGPEVIMGSSRMKSGTAQKLILNTISTGVMIRLGKVYSNLMVEMPATNIKLQRRSERMVELASGARADVARRALEQSGGNIKLAIIIARSGVSVGEARRLLDQNSGDLRKALGE